MYDILNGYQELIKFGLVHEDIKPSNILVNNNIFKIGDFGLTQKVG
jgi:serine/threonine protein kinase